MERMAVVSDERLTLELPRAEPAWRLRPRAPYPLVPATRRLEWLAFVATPIGGIMTVVDHNSAGGVGMVCFLVALAIGVPWLLIELLYVLPPSLAQALNYTLGGIVALIVAGILGIGVYAVPEAMGFILAIVTAVWGGFWFWDHRKPA